MLWLCIADAFIKFAIFENLIFLNEMQLSEKKESPISVFSRFLYIPLKDKVLCVLLGGRQALTRHIIIGGSVGS